MIQRFMCVQLYTIMYNYVDTTVAYTAMVSEATYIEFIYIYKLSTECVTASSVNKFKNKVDTYLGRADCPCPFAKSG